LQQLQASKQVGCAVHCMFVTQCCVILAL
jgi:hypothetical protein